MIWTENYIPDAATRLVKHQWRGRTYETSNYDPPDNGVHLCGQHADDEQPYTAASYPMGADNARKLFLLAKAAAETPREEGDFVVDLLIGGDIEDDFWTSRQMWSRAIAAWNVASLQPEQAG